MVKRGEYIFRASGGCSCHTVPGSFYENLAGRRALKTPFGAIYSTNITPDGETGIGNWSQQDFSNAMTKGIRPDGSHLFPVFPYTSFTRMKPQDVEDLKVYLDTIEPVVKSNRDDDLFFLFKWRMGNLFWKLIHFKEGMEPSNQNKSEQWNRGDYLVNALAHCGECHTPRDISGGLKKDLLFSGSVDGPEGQFAPNITPDQKSGIGDWSKGDFTWFLKSGQKPDGDYTGGLMTEVIIEGYQYLTEQDLQAIAIYFFDLNPIFNELKKE